MATSYLHANSFTIFLILKVILTSSIYAQTDYNINSLNDYSFDLYNQLKSNNENLFFSSLSTYLALSMAYEGSKGDTKNEFEKVLHLKNGVNNNDLIKMNTWNINSKYSFISNAIWIHDKFKIENCYKKIIENKYSANVFSMDFSASDDTALKINDWVLESTNNLIKNIIAPEDINNFTRIIMTSTVYFEGEWEEKFDIRFTKKADFYSIGKDTVKIDYMNKTEYLNYYENNQLQFVSIQYKGSDISFCIILPQKKFGIVKTELKLNRALLDTLLNNMSRSQVQISLPKFKLETNYSLIKSLNNMGLIRAFNSSADFTRISPYGQLVINKANHKAFIEIDEKKTEAGAASIVSMNVGSAKGFKPKLKIFNADHPFIFFILNNKNRGIIFMGRYVKPFVHFI